MGLLEGGIDGLLEGRSVGAELGLLDGLGVGAFVIGMQPHLSSKHSVIGS